VAWVALGVVGFLLVSAITGGVIILARQGHSAGSPAVGQGPSGPIPCKGDKLLRCMSGITAQDFIKPLEAQGLSCTRRDEGNLLQSYSCDQNASDYSYSVHSSIALVGGEADVFEFLIDVVGDNGPREQVAKKLLPIVAAVPFKNDQALAGTARDWTNQAMTNGGTRKIGGYDYTMDAGNGFSLTITASLR
jgi:hypothetical protein